MIALGRGGGAQKAKGAAMAFREVRVHEVREVLRQWVGSELGLRPIAERAGVDRKTARRYIDAAVELGVARECGLQQLTDVLIGAVINAVRPERSTGHGPAWERLLGVFGGDVEAQDFPGGIRARLRERVVLIGPEA